MHRLKIVALALVALLMLPAGAYASEINYLDSFTGGLADTVKAEGKADESKVDGESGNGGILRVGEEEESDFIGYIRQVLLGAKFTFNGSTVRPLVGTAVYVNYLLIFVPTAVGMVFFWWGVRKALRVLMAAFRRGKSNV